MKRTFTVLATAVVLFGSSLAATAAVAAPSTSAPDAHNVRVTWILDCCQ